MLYNKLGIEIHEPGSELHNAPKWAIEQDENSTNYGCLKGYLIDSGQYYIMPLSSVDATQLASDCADYAHESGIKIDEYSLSLYFQDETDSRIYENFYN